MKKVLIFGGTTEGRKIAKTLSASGLFCDVRVATPYGSQFLKENQNLKVSVGRLTLEEMENLCQKEAYSLVIDGTHPFATVVRQNIKSAAEKSKIQCLRFERNTCSSLETSSDLSFFNSTEECIAALQKETGRILLTTGSKELFLYCKNPELREKLVVRVLPALESLKLCSENGLKGNQIIAMQGPFSKEMNLIQLKEYGISVLVTKESGKNGGLDEKLVAAAEQGVKTFIIKNPESLTEKSGTLQKSEFYEAFSSSQAFYSKIEQLLDVKIAAEQPSVKIFLAGIGPGNPDYMTVAVQKAISEADYLFGAPRMLEAVSASGVKIPFYLAKDIIPEIEKILAENKNRNKYETTVTVLFSGDTGFFSGEEKLYKELKKLKNIEIEVLPGLSSIQVMASKTGFQWQDFVIISMHGVSESIWLTQLEKALKADKAVFLLTSGFQDVQKLNEILLENGKKSQYTLISGYNLSYDDEKIIQISPEKSTKVDKNGLYSVMLIPESF